MRKKFVSLATEAIKSDPNVFLLLGDISVFGFRAMFKDYPLRVKNVGIMEQAMVGMAAGMALTGMKPIVHTIAPFLVERAYEQLKIDFGYQKLSGTFVSVGGSYDYAGLGCTHHCPADVSLMENIEGFSIYVPGHPDEFEYLFKETCNNPGSRYFRMSEQSNKEPQNISLSGPTLVRKSHEEHPNGPVVLAVGPCLDMVLTATAGLPVNVYYTTVVSPFPLYALPINNQNVIVVEPYNSSQLARSIADYNSTKLRPVTAKNFDIPRRKFARLYGNKEQLDVTTGFYADNLRSTIEKYFPL